MKILNVPSSYFLCWAFILFHTISFSQIRIAEPKKDLGNIFEKNGEVQTVFELINPYPNDTIFILNINTSCGCTAILSTDTLILPKSKINLKVSYNPEGRVGLFSKSIQIETLTGQTERNSLYLQITGNVIGNISQQPSKKINLIAYQIAPLYFFPINVYDTSYLDLSRIKTFVNDITYETDFYQFSNIGIEIKIANIDYIPKIEYSIRFLKYKLIREMKRRGYLAHQIVFEEPVFKYDNNIPSWSAAKIKLFSAYFNNDDLTESKIITTKTDWDKNEYYWLNEKSNKVFQVDSLIKKIDKDMVAKTLFHDAKLFVNGEFLYPENYSYSNALKLISNFGKKWFKKLKKEHGINKKKFKIDWIKIQSHASTNFTFKIWQKEDEKIENNIYFVEKKEDLVIPLLPTYKQILSHSEYEVDTQSIYFIQFWKTLILTAEKNTSFYLILENSTSDQYAFQSSIRNAQATKGEKVKEFLEKKYYRETGKLLDVKTKNTFQGPFYHANYFEKEDYYAYEYIKLIPVYELNRNLPIKPEHKRNYIINYDYYFLGIDTSSFVFKNFAIYLVYEIQTKGYIEIELESSASHLPIDKYKSNQYLAFKHLEESKKRLFLYLEKKLTDPNRIIFTNENIIVQGIPYDKKTPIARYREFQYVSLKPLEK